MGLLDIFRGGSGGGGGGGFKKLTEPEVRAMEERAKYTKEQLALTKRYVKAKGIVTVTEAEIKHVTRLGEEISKTAVREINQHSRQAIAGAREATKAAVQNRLNSYAKGLLSSGGGGGD